MNDEFKKRFRGFLWIVLAGTIATGLGLVVQNIAMLQLSPQVEAIVVIVLTAIISQITKWLNSGSVNSQPDN